MDFCARTISLRWIEPEANGSPVQSYELLQYRSYVEKREDGSIVACQPPPDHPGLFKRWIVPTVQVIASFTVLTPTPTYVVIC